jgi:hypothetical protein
MSRYRPIHVQALFLAGTAPAADQSYLYTAQDTLSGEAAALLRSLEINADGKTVEAVLTEFQRRRYLLAHLVDCAAEPGEFAASREALARRLPSTLTRIRRSFKPKRLVLIGGELTELVPQFAAADLGAALLLNNGKPFEWNEIGDGVLRKELGTRLQAV